MMVIGGTMIYSFDDIKKVLALYDSEDIPFILFNNIFKEMKPLNSNNMDTQKVKVKSKTIGEGNDRKRKQ